MKDSPWLVRASTQRLDLGAALGDLQQQLLPLQGQLAGVLVFASPRYAYHELSRGLLAIFGNQVVACSTAGEIGDSFFEGIQAVGLSSSHFALHTLELPTLNGESVQLLRQRALELLHRLTFAPRSQRFGLLLVDGLCQQEEVLVANLYRSFNGMPLIGGSAGDDLQFLDTRVLCGGEFRSGAATFTVIESLLPFEVLHVKHFEPSEHDLVITRSDPRRRIVYEIDGVPAAEQLARILDLSIADLNPQVFSRYPMMLQIGDQWYVRSIQRVNADGSLSFFCAIDDGLPLTLARGVGLAETMERTLKDVQRRFSKVHLTLGVDCVLRRLEIRDKQLEGRVCPVLQQLRFAGFSSFGEQLNALHVNQTLTAVVLGEKE